MLVLSRNENQCIMIGDTVKITVLSIKGKQVRLGVDAPKDVIVHREEIHNKILFEREKIKPV